MKKEIEEVTVVEDPKKEYKKQERDMFIQVSLIWVLGWLNAWFIIGGIYFFRKGSYFLCAVFVLLFLGTKPPTMNQMYRRGKYLNMRKTK